MQKPLDHIIVSLDELYEQVCEMKRRGMTYAELMIDNAYMDEGELCPATLSLTGIRASEPDCGVEWEPIDAVDVAAPGMYMSENNL